MYECIERPMKMKQRKNNLIHKNSRVEMSNIGILETEHSLQT